MTKAELQALVAELEGRFDLAVHDLKEACDALWKFEHRHILVKVYRDHDLVDAVVIPPSGSMYSPLSVNPIHPDDDSVGISTEVIS